MKKITFYFLSVFMMMLSWQNQGQVVIGEGTVTGQNMPIEPFYGYTYSQNILLQSEINAVGNITTLTYKFAGTSISNSDSWVVYMGHTSKTQFDSTTDWIPVSSLTEVFNGTVTLDANNNVVIDITDFAYNNTDNLVIAIDENKASYNGTADDFYCTSVATPRGIVYYSDYTDPDPTTPPTANATKNYIANVILGGITQACPNPTALTASNVTASTADLAWTSASTQFNVQYGITGFTLGEGTIVNNITTTNHSLSSLIPATVYQFYVQAVCGTESSGWSGPFSFQTSCVSVTEFTQNFDGVATSTFPICWGKVGTLGSATLSSSYSSSPSNSLYLYSSSATSQAVVKTIPVSNLGAGTHQLRFKMRASSTVGGIVEIGYLTTANDAASFVALGSVTASTTTFDEYIYIPVAGTYTDNLALRHTGVPSNSVYIDDVAWELIPTCPNPTALTASNVTSSTADLAWTSASTQFNVQYGITGFTLGEGTIVNNITTTNHSLSSLIPATVYQFYVQAVCGTESSGWSGPFSFQTSCVSVTEFTQNFDGVATSTFPICWGKVGTLGSATLSSSYSSSPSNSLYLYSSSATSRAVVKTIPVSNLGAGTHQLRFKMRAGFTVGGIVEIGYLTTANDAASFVALGSVTASTTTFDEYIYIPVAGTYTDNLALRHTGVPSNSVYIDDVAWELIPTCPRPSVLTVTGVTTSNATLGWTVNGSETSWDIEYGVTGFTQGNGTIINVGTNPYTLNTLSVDTDYQFYVRAHCTDTDMSAWAGPKDFSTLCNPYTIPYFEGFENGYTDATPVSGCLLQESITGTEVWTANSTNTTYNRTPRTGAFNATLRYANEDWIFIPINLVGGTTYLAKLYARQDMSNVTYANMSIAYGSAPSAASMTNAIVTDFVIINGDYQEVTGFFTPETSGTYFVGIKGKISGTPWYISLDDISIDVAPPCPNVSQLTATNIGAYSADLGWTSNGNETTWNIEFGETGFVQGNGYVETGVTVNPFTFEGLTPVTSYQFYVQAVCGNGNNSTWAGPFSFTTTEACPKPTALAAANITSSSAVLSWTSGATTFNVEYGPTGFTQGGGLMVNGITNPYTLTSLTAATAYQYYVQADCGSVDGLSNWAGPFSFQTACETQTVPYYEPFNTYLPSVCWIEADNGDLVAGPATFGSSNWIGDGFANVGTTGAVRYNIWLASANDWLISPKFNIPATGYEFLYKVAVTQWGATTAPTTPWEADDFVEVLVSTSTTNWTVLTTYNSSNVPSATGDIAIFDLDAYAGQDVYFAFRAVEGTANGSADIEFFIDDFQIRMTPSSVPVCATNLVATPDAACGNRPTSLAWDVVNGVDGYHLTIGTTAGASDVFSGNLTANTYVVNSQNYNTTYFWKVVPFNSFGDAVDCSEQSYTTFATGCYCPSVPSSNDAQGITNVQLVSTDYVIDDVTYSDQTAGTVVDMPQGELINAQISFATGFTYNTYIWIDFNNNYTFESSELVYSGESTSANPTVLNASFTMPASAALGTHRMRIGTADSGATPNPCYSGSWGVTVDFNVNVVEPTSSISDNVIDGFRMYPNPVTNILNLNAQNKIDNVSIYNMLGQEVLRINPNQTQVQLDVNVLTSGAYIVKVKSGDQIGAYNLIKN